MTTLIYKVLTVTNGNATTMPRNTSMPSTARAHTPVAGGVVKKKRKQDKFKKMSRTIRDLQLSTDLILKKGPFQRIVRSVCNEMHGKDMRFQRNAIMMLQEAAEVYLIGKLEGANCCASHAKRVTTMPKDVELVNMLDMDLHRRVEKRNSDAGAR